MNKGLAQTLNSIVELQQQNHSLSLQLQQQTQLLGQQRQAQQHAQACHSLDRQRLTSELDRKQAELEGVKGRQLQLLSSVEEALRKERSDKLQLARELEQARNTCCRLSAQVQRLQSCYSSLETKCSQNFKRAQLAELELADSQQQYQVVLLKLKQSQAELQHFSEEAEVQGKRQDESQQLVSSLQSQKCCLLQEIEGLRREDRAKTGFIHIRLKGLVAQLTASLGCAVDSELKGREEHSRLLEQLRSLKSQVSTLESAKAKGQSYEKKYSLLKKKHRKSQEQQDSLFECRAALKTALLENQSLRHQVQQLTVDMTNQARDIAQSRQHLEQRVRETGRLERAIREWREKCLSLQRSNHELQLQRDMQMQQVATLQQEIRHSISKEGEVRLRVVREVQ